MERTPDPRDRRHLERDCPFAAAVVRFLVWATRNNASSPGRQDIAPSAVTAAATPDRK
ncbi:MAG TPA: hypothetical protein VE053_07675 [Allosphingosinicella sp.]|nr:hypothetical protein [Allosphingosinicella sp.]